jgi:hypothetical protein
MASETLITNLIDKGLQEGWLKRFRRIPQKTGTETIYLVENAQVFPTGSSDQHESSATTSSAHDAGQDAHANSNPVETPSQSTEISGSPSIDCRPRKHANRATEFEAMLSASRIGAMPESRERLFEAVAAILTENKGSALPLLELFKRAVARAQESSERDQYLVEKNWPVVQLCIRRLMLWAGVLLDPDNNPISDKIGSNAKEVTGLAPDFRRICEAYLVEHIIEKAGGVNYDDETYYIGLTIYRRGIERAVPADELKAKADAILAFLEESGRIYLDSDRVLRVKPARNRALAVAG